MEPPWPHPPDGELYRARRPLVNWSKLPWTQEYGDRYERMEVLEEGDETCDSVDIQEASETEMQRKSTGNVSPSTNIPVGLQEAKYINRPYRSCRRKRTILYDKYLKRFEFPRNPIERECFNDWPRSISPRVPTPFVGPEMDAMVQREIMREVELSMLFSKLARCDSRVSEQGSPVQLTTPRSCSQPLQDSTQKCPELSTEQGSPVQRTTPRSCSQPLQDSTQKCPELSTEQGSPVQLTTPRSYSPPLQVSTPKCPKMSAEKKARMWTKIQSLSRAFAEMKRAAEHPNSPGGSLPSPRGQTPIHDPDVVVTEELIAKHIKTLKLQLALFDRAQKSGPKKESTPFEISHVDSTEREEHRETSSYFAATHDGVKRHQEEHDFRGTPSPLPLSPQEPRRHKGENDFRETLSPLPPTPLGPRRQKGEYIRGTPTPLAAPQLGPRRLENECMIREIPSARSESPCGSHIQSENSETLRKERMSNMKKPSKIPLPIRPKPKTVAPHKISRIPLPTRLLRANVETNRTAEPKEIRMFSKNAPQPKPTFTVLPRKTCKATKLPVNQRAATLSLKTPSVRGQSATNVSGIPIRQKQPAFSTKPPTGRVGKSNRVPQLSNRFAANAIETSPIWEEPECMSPVCETDDVMDTAPTPRLPMEERNILASMHRRENISHRNTTQRNDGYSRRLNLNTNPTQRNVPVRGRPPIRSLPDLARGSRIPLPLGLSVTCPDIPAEERPTRIRKPTQEYGTSNGPHNSRLPPPECTPRDEGLATCSKPPRTPTSRKGSSPPRKIKRSKTSKDTDKAPSSYLEAFRQKNATRKVPTTARTIKDNQASKDKDSAPTSYLEAFRQKRKGSTATRKTGPVGVATRNTSIRRPTDEQPPHHPYETEASHERIASHDLNIESPTTMTHRSQYADLYDEEHSTNFLDEDQEDYIERLDLDLNRNNERETFSEGEEPHIGEWVEFRLCDDTEEDTFVRYQQEHCFEDIELFEYEEEDEHHLVVAQEERNQRRRQKDAQTNIPETRHTTPLSDSDDYEEFTRRSKQSSGNVARKSKRKNKGIQVAHNCCDERRDKHYSAVGNDFHHSLDKKKADECDGECQRGGKDRNVDNYRNRRNANSPDRKAAKPIVVKQKDRDTQTTSESDRKHKDGRKGLWGRVKDIFSPRKMRSPVPTKSTVQKFKANSGSRFRKNKVSPSPASLSTERSSEFDIDTPEPAYQICPAESVGRAQMFLAADCINCNKNRKPFWNRETRRAVQESSRVHGYNEANKYDFRLPETPEDTEYYRRQLPEQ